MTRRTPSPWIGTAYRHIRATASRGVLDFRFTGTFARNRWNEPGEPTLYLTGDPGVLVAEWGRQLRTSFSEDVIRETIEREAFRLSIHLDRVIDLRLPETTRQAGIRHFPVDIMDRDNARAAARWIRNETTAQGMLVPSIAFLDDPTRWNLVVFLDRVPGNVQQWISSVERIGPLRWN